VGLVGVELDAKVLAVLVWFYMVEDSGLAAHLCKVVEVPVVVLARPVSWKVGRCLVANDLGADGELLYAC
jgi:hypothetical protein